VLVPLLVPAMLASLLVSFALSIDDFVVSQYLASGADTTTVPMRIYSQARGGPTPALNALATIMLLFSLLAVVLAYVIFRTMTRGEDRGSAVKQLAMDMG
jgi:spermidine/putrescine transport system permease protein